MHLEAQLIEGRRMREGGEKIPFLRSLERERTMPNE